MYTSISEWFLKVFMPCNSDHMTYISVSLHGVILIGVSLPILVLIVVPGRLLFTTGLQPKDKNTIKLDAHFMQVNWELLLFSSSDKFRQTLLTG